MPAHRQCLTSFPPHCPDQDGPALYSEPCQEVDFEEFVYTASLLDSRLQDGDKTALHVDDLWSTWFGVPHDQEGPLPQLHIYPRLHQLIADNPNPKRPPRQYPSLISLVGDTGSGKSTLIRAIIRMLAPRAHKDYRVPVPGSASDGFDSTSSDVHLFADPGTRSSTSPLYFVGTFHILYLALLLSNPTDTMPFQIVKGSPAPTLQCHVSSFPMLNGQRSLSPFAREPCEGSRQPGRPKICYQSMPLPPPVRSI